MTEEKSTSTRGDDTNPRLRVEKVPTLHDLGRYYVSGGLVGEERAGITATMGLAGDASVVILGYPGTGKTHGADLCIKLLPESLVCPVDMVSKLGIWSAGMVERITAARVLYLSELQNSGDNDEVVKVLKKFGDGKAATREKSEHYGQDTSITELPCRTFLATAAITNTAVEKSFDLESARRVVKVSTNPSEAATGRVLASKARALVEGKEAARGLTALEEARIKAHAKKVFVENHEAVSRVRFFGAVQLLNAIPKTFPESRSAFALFEKVLLGVGRWYADTEVRVGSEVFLSPQRVAEAWSFYGDILVENALKWDTSDREILSAFPAPAWNGEAVAPEACLDLAAIMRKLKPYGLTDQALVKRQIARLEMKGFLAETEAFSRTRWHKTGLADVANVIDWPAVIKACQDAARDHLEGDALQRYLALCTEASGPRAIQNPISGETGPIHGPGSVLYIDSASGQYAPVGVPAKPAKGTLSSFL